MNRHLEYRLQEVFESPQMLACYHLVYGTLKRLGYDNALTAWNMNPMLFVTINERHLPLSEPAKRIAARLLFRRKKEL